MDITNYVFKMTIEAKKELDDSIIDPISFQLIEWGLDPKQIEWEVFKDKANLCIKASNEDEDFNVYAMTFQGLNEIMLFCQDYHLVIDETIGNDESEEHTIYTSDYDETSFTTVSN